MPPKRNVSVGNRKQLPRQIIIRDSHVTINTTSHVGTTQVTTINKMVVAAQQYLDLRLHTIPLRPGTKRPIHDDWNRLRLDHTTFDSHFTRGAGLGVLLGIEHAYAVDFDVDDSGALKIVSEGLIPGQPDTRWVFGRRSKRRSHFIYRFPGTFESEQFQDDVDKKGNEARGEKQKHMLVELRGENCQTAFPPTVHPSGEPIEWVETPTRENIGQTTIAKLRPWVARVASAALFARHYPALGDGHTFAHTLSGWLGLAGWSEEDAATLVLASAIAKGDPDLSERRRNVKSTYERLAEGKTVRQRRHLEEVLGENGKAICAKVAEWLELKSADGPFRADVANAALFAEMHAGFVVWSSDQEVWRAFDGKRFASNNIGEVMRRGRETVRRLYEIAIGLPSGDDASSDTSKARKAAFHRASSAEQTIAQFIRLARSEESLEAMKFDETFDLDAYLFNCADGIINLRTGELSPHDPAKRITMLSPIGYDQNATAPQFEMFLLHACAGSDALKEYLIRLMGYFLSGLTDEQSFWLFQGPSKTSKTTFINIIRGLLGDYATTLPESAVMMNPRTNEEHGLAQLAGVRLATMVEIGQGKRYDEAKLKQITGQDKITASKKYQNYFEFNSKAKLAMAGNHLPKVHDTDDSIWNRIKRVPFNVEVLPDKRVKNLHLKLLNEEGPGILALAVRGFQRWANDGFVEPKEIKDAINEYREGQDVVLQFVDEECDRGAAKKVECGRLFSEFIHWKDRNGFRTAWSKTAFGLELKRLNFDTKHSTGRWYVGIALRDHAGFDDQGSL